MSDKKEGSDRREASQMTTKFNRFAFGFYWAIKTRIHQMKLMPQDKVVEQALMATKKESPSLNFQLRDIV